MLKCKVCDHEFTQEELFKNYTMVKEANISLISGVNVKYHDAYDCPKCNHQNVIDDIERLEEVENTVNEKAKEKEKESDDKMLCHNCKYFDINCRDYQCKECYGSGSRINFESKEVVKATNHNPIFPRDLTDEEVKIFEAGYDAGKNAERCNGNKADDIKLSKRHCYNCKYVNKRIDDVKCVHCYGDKDKPNFEAKEKIQEDSELKKIIINNKIACEYALCEHARTPWEEYPCCNCYNKFNQKHSLFKLKKSCGTCIYDGTKVTSFPCNCCLSCDRVKYEYYEAKEVEL
jgi:hypothetical protein